LPINGTVGQGFAGGNTVTIDGTRAYGNSYLASSVIAFAGAGNPALLRKTNANLVKPEEVKAIELDTDHLLIEHLSILTDNMYTNFIGNLNVVTPLYGQAIDGGGLTNVEGQKRFML
jgi:hypothetical protein